MKSIKASVRPPISVTYRSCIDTKNSCEKRLAECSRDRDSAIAVDFKELAIDAKDDESMGLLLKSAIDQEIITHHMSLTNCDHSECSSQSLVKHTHIPAFFFVTLKNVNRAPTSVLFAPLATNYIGDRYRLHAVFLPSTKHPSVEVRTPGGFLRFPERVQSDEKKSSDCSMSIHPKDSNDNRLFPLAFEYQESRTTDDTATDNVTEFECLFVCL
jgi:hypothetical protein